MVAAIGAFLYLLTPPEHPIPHVKTDGISVPVTEGSYCWEGPLSANCVDKVYANPIEMGKQHEPTDVMPNQTIKITFDKMPTKNSLKIERWIEGGSSEKVKLNHSKLHAPSQKGTYFYLITANWEQGDGKYSFSIKVE